MGMLDGAAGTCYHFSRPETRDKTRMGATGFDFAPDCMGCRQSCSDSLNGAKNLTANTYQEQVALVA